jgi:ATP-binding cassette, subfamily B, multidrug efflux pump
VLIGLLRNHLRPYARSVVLLLLLQLLQICATLYLPTLNAQIIDHGVVRGDTDYILRFGLLMIGVSLAQIASNVAAVYFGARASGGMARDIRAVIFDRVQSFSAREVGQFGAPTLITRTTNDVRQVQQVVLASFTLLVSAPIMCVGGVVLALGQDVRLSSVLLVVLPVLALLVGLIVRRLRPLFRQMQVRLDEINQVLSEQISGVRVVRAFAKDAHERQRFRAHNTGLRNVQLQVGRLMVLMGPTVLTVVNVASVAVVWFGAPRIEDGDLRIGALTAFLAYLLQTASSVLMASFMFIMVPRAEVCAERITEVLNTEPSVAPPATPVRTLRRNGELAMQNAGFRYPGAEEPVLQGVTLLTRPGETTAVVGSTGSGKSTLLGLIPRLFDTTEGDVWIGGEHVRSLDPALLARTVGLVPQRPYLFSGTVASNLRYGRTEATDGELWRALEIAQAREFVAAMEGGLDASIGQGGNNVSGGQRQRLAIARVLVQRPQIYLFDDSFSALDNLTDATLRAALAEETAGAAKVIVAQRVSTIRDADRIVVLNEGRVAGMGRHEELMDGNGVYREIVLSQLTEDEAV